MHYKAEIAITGGSIYPYRKVGRPFPGRGTAQDPSVYVAACADGDTRL